MTPQDSDWFLPGDARSFLASSRYGLDYDHDIMAAGELTIVMVETSEHSTYFLVLQQSTAGDGTFERVGSIETKEAWIREGFQKAEEKTFRIVSIVTGDSLHCRNNHTPL